MTMMLDTLAVAVFSPLGILIFLVAVCFGMVILAAIVVFPLVLMVRKKRRDTAARSAQDSAGT